MDPDQLLKEIRELVKQLQTDYQNTIHASVDDEQETADACVDHGYELEEKVNNLDEWISKGGSLPKAWQPKK